MVRLHRLLAAIVPCGALLGAWACTVPDLNVTGKRCPCGDGFFCDRTQSPPRCVAGSQPVAEPCGDGLQNGDEEDVDCGGRCASCPGATCTQNGDCVTESCVAGICELASDPPKWIEVASLPHPRFDLAATVGLGADDRIYAIGGIDTSAVGTVFTYQRAPAPDGAWSSDVFAVEARRGLTATTGADGTVYAIGGKVSQPPGAQVFDLVEALSPGTSTWTQISKLTVPRYGAASALAEDGRIYVFAGTNELQATLPSIEGLDGGIWQAEKSVMSAGRVQPAAVSGGDSLVVCGGKDGAGNALRSCEAYSTPKHAWSTRADMPTKRFGLAAAAGTDNRYYFIGGQEAGSNEAFTVVEAYVPPVNGSADRWTGAASLPYPSTSLAAVTGRDGCVYAIGGIQHPNGTDNLKSVVKYCPVIGLSPATGPVGTPIQITGSNFASNARVYVSIAGVVVVIAKTDADGNMIGAPSFDIPSDCGAPCLVTAMDSRSRYPVSARFITTQ